MHVIEFLVKYIIYYYLILINTAHPEPLHFHVETTYL